MNKSVLKNCTIAASVILLFVIYRVGGLWVALIYFGVIFVLTLLYLLTQDSRLMLKLNLEKFSRAINSKFDDLGGLFACEGSYMRMPVGFREVNNWAGTDLEVYCRPREFHTQFFDKIVYPSAKTVIRPGSVCLNNVQERFASKELSDNDILEMLEELRKAAFIVENGHQPYKVEPVAIRSTFLISFFASLIALAVFLYFKLHG